MAVVLRLRHATTKLIFRETFNSQPDWPSLVEVIREICLCDLSTPVCATYVDPDNQRTTISAQRHLTTFYSLFSGVTLPTLDVGSREEVAASGGSEGEDTVKRKREDETPSDPNGNAQKRLNALQDLTWAQAKTAASPSTAAVAGAINSQQQKARLYNGRPDCLHGPPISIYHESFGIFLDVMAQETDLPPEDYLDARRFMEVAAQSYDIEKERQDAMNAVFSKILGLAVEAKDHQVTKTDGSGCISINVHGVPTFVEIFADEFKNEIGQGHADPTLQLGFAMRKICTLPARAQLGYASCSPTLLASIAGPHMMVSGFVLADIAIQQPLTDFVWLANPGNRYQVRKVAQLFHAMKSSLHSLRSYYEQLQPSPTRIPSACLPPYTTFGDETRNTSIMYTGRVLNEQVDLHRAIFYAVTISGHLHKADGRLLVVKFVEQYGDVAHNLLAGMDLAPKLHWCSRIPGGLLMVVMDQVNGKTVVEADLSGTLPRGARNDVRRALNELHCMGRVFGDLRGPNVMLTGPHLRLDAFGTPTGERDDDELHAMLIDFDWCGEEGKQRYPENINTTDNIQWHEEVDAGRLFSRAHDEYMFERL